MPLANAWTITKLFHVSAGTNLAGPILSDDVNHRRSRCQPPQVGHKTSGHFLGKKLAPRAGGLTVSPPILGASFLVRKWSSFFSTAVEARVCAPKYGHENVPLPL